MVHKRPKMGGLAAFFQEPPEKWETTVFLLAVAVNPLRRIVAELVSEGLHNPHPFGGFVVVNQPHGTDRPKGLGRPVEAPSSIGHDIADGQEEDPDRVTVRAARQVARERLSAQPADALTADRPPEAPRVEPRRGLAEATAAHGASSEDTAESSKGRDLLPASRSSRASPKVWRLATPAVSKSSPGTDRPGVDPAAAACKSIAAESESGS
jgi:hypothetical protein